MKSQGRKWWSQWSWRSLSPGRRVPTSYSLSRRPRCRSRACRSPPLPSPASLPPGPVQWPSLLPVPVKTAPVAVDGGAAGSRARPAAVDVVQPVPAAAPARAAARAGPCPPQPHRRARSPAETAGNRGTSSADRRCNRLGLLVESVRPARREPRRPRAWSRRRASCGACSRRSQRAWPRSDDSRSACSCAARACAASPESRAPSWQRAWAHGHAGGPARAPCAALAAAHGPRGRLQRPRARARAVVVRARRVSEPLPALEGAAPAGRQAVKGYPRVRGWRGRVVAERAPRAARA